MSGIKGCSNRGYKSARVIDDAVFKVVSAVIFTEEFTAALTGPISALLADAARRPQWSIKRLENAIAARERQIARVDNQLVGMEGDAAIRSIVAKVKELQADLDQLREQLAEQRRRSKRPPITRVKEKDVLAELNRLREVLHSDVGVAAPALHALTGDVVIEARPAENGGQPKLVARFTINALPALASLGDGIEPEGTNGPSKLWEFLGKDLSSNAGSVADTPVEIIVPLKRPAGKDNRQQV